MTLDDQDDGLDRPRPNPFEPSKRFGRDEVEFGRALAFFDATFAIAATLLVVSLNPSDLDWRSWSTLFTKEWPSLLSFGISFAVIAAYWWANHRLVSVLDQISTRFVMWALVLLGFVALVPFTTEGLGQYGHHADGTVATVLYSLNVAIVSILSTFLVVVAWRERLYRVQPTARELRAQLIALCDTPLVFLLSIPVAVLISPNWGRATWALLAVTGWATHQLAERVAGRG